MRDLLTDRDALVAILLCWNAMISFVLLIHKKHRWLDVVALGVFITYWLATLAFSKSMEVKFFVTVLMASILLFRFLVLRRRKRIASDDSMH